MQIGKEANWNETFSIEIKDITTFSSMVKFTLKCIDPKGKSIECGDETISFLILYVNGSGFKDSFYLY